MPERQWSSVDFPEPEGPMMVTNSASSTVRVTERSTVVSVESVRKERPRSWASTSVAMGER